ncbi:IclR family transcriptional regulator C-terminal domain-containing protein [Bordetella sp. BOR01]|uniref:IclR family transcriptional regulator domain-containing protein n=1 Tax=Bordetella sp. BOR01 TaxID=2854779 RepID=UPI001C487F31|nr:IclR family transcriptional regulator C-terminal domain-containing protein [Bordetella sp. BOR01]MBV7481492.1 helix-turn-helix domain-containing protein [Bordetella sp. BOR01]
MTQHQGLPKGSDLFVEAFARGLAVIRAFGPSSRELTLSEVAERAGVTPAGARRLLHTLVTLGYARIDGRTFSLTPAVLDIGYSYLNSLSLREVALPYLEQFAREHGEICSLSVLDKNDIIYVARAEIRSPSARRLITGERLPAHATSTGHVLLAQLAPQELDGFLAQVPFERLTPHTLVDAQPLRAAIQAAQAQGYALASQHYELGVCALAVPVHNRQGQLVAALTTSLNQAKHPVDGVVPSFLPSLQHLAREISQGLT